MPPAPSRQLALREPPTVGDAGKVEPAIANQEATAGSMPPALIASRHGHAPSLARVLDAQPHRVGRVDVGAAVDDFEARVEAASASRCAPGDAHDLVAHERAVEVAQLEREQGARGDRLVELYAQAALALVEGVARERARLRGALRG